MPTEILKRVPRMKRMILLCSLLFILPTSYATDLISYNRHVGPYIGFNAGTNLFIATDEEITMTEAVGMGWSTEVGYNFKSYFGLEAGFIQTYIKTYDGDYGHADVPYLAARFTIPMSNRFSFIGKVGSMEGIVTRDKIVLPYVSVGLSYALTPSLDLETQYQGAVYGLVNVGLIGAGLVYHF